MKNRSRTLSAKQTPDKTILNLAGVLAEINRLTGEFGLDSALQTLHTLVQGKKANITPADIAQAHASLGTSSKKPEQGKVIAITQALSPKRAPLPPSGIGAQTRGSDIPSAAGESPAPLIFAPGRYSQADGLVALIHELPSGNLKYAVGVDAEGARCAWHLNGVCTRVGYKHANLVSYLGPMPAVSSAIDAKVADLVARLTASKSHGSSRSSAIVQERRFG